jgi:hypothetical protein
MSREEHTISGRRTLTAEFERQWVGPRQFHDPVSGWLRQVFGGPYLQGKTFGGNEDS